MLVLDIFHHGNYCSFLFTNYNRTSYKRSPKDVLHPGWRRDNQHCRVLDDSTFKYCAEIHSAKINGVNWSSLID